MLPYFEKTLTEYAQLLLNSNFILKISLLLQYLPRLRPTKQNKKKNRTYKMGHKSVAGPNRKRRLSGEKQNEAGSRTEIS